MNFWAALRARVLQMEWFGALVCVGPPVTEFVHHLESPGIKL